MTKLLAAVQVTICLAFSAWGMVRLPPHSTPGDWPVSSAARLEWASRPLQETGGAATPPQAPTASQKGKKEPTNPKSIGTPKPSSALETPGPPTNENGSDKASNPALSKENKNGNANSAGEASRQSYHDSIEAYWWTFRVMTRLLIVLVVVLILTLSIFSFAGKWSLADALSEESSVQPNPGQVKMVASTSRLIALVGLMGILAIVLGVGYSTVWNLFIGGAANLHLDEIRKFLFGAATLFAPYLANQLRSIFDDTPAKPVAPAPPAPALVPGPVAAPAPVAVAPPGPVVAPGTTPPAVAPGAAPGATGAGGKTGTP